MKKNKERDSNLELLRIVSMIMIILHHLICYNLQAPHNITNYLFLGLGKIGVGIFMLITGYYMINKKNISYKKIFLLELQVLFYTIIILLIYTLITNNLNIDLLFSSLLPLITKSYWFYTSYFVIYILIPIINKVINKLNQFQYFMIIIGMTWIIIICHVLSFDETLLLYYYLIGGYIRKYVKIKNNNIYLIISTCTYTLMCIIEFFINKYYFNLDNIYVTICSVTLFIYFLNLDIKYNKTINNLASSSFAVYLIHENEIIRSILWKKIFVINSNTNCIILFILGIIISIGIYYICHIIEKIRKKIFSRLNIDKYLTNIT